jgi:TRAP-type C4-dicarboxylate transport system substrate-binding protein
MPKGVSIAVGFDWWAEEFPKRTDGRYKVEVYPGGTLVPIEMTLDAVKSGVIEMSMTSVGNFLKVFPLSAVFQLPTVAPFPATAEGFAASDGLFNDEMIPKFPELQAEYNDWHLCYHFGLTPYTLVMKKKEVHKAADFKGTRIGGTGPKMLMVTANGGAEVKQVPPDSYMNMDKGVTDGAFVTANQWNNYKLFEVADYFYDMNFGPGSMPMLMNKEFYNSMSAEDQKILDDLWREAAAGPVIDSHLKYTVMGYDDVKNSGKKLVSPTPEEITAWQQAAQPVKDKWLEDAKAAGTTSEKAVLDAWAKLYSDWAAKNK